jgi:hypothetical protein
LIVWEPFETKGIVFWAVYLIANLIGFQSKSGPSENDRLNRLCSIFFEILISTIPEAQASRMCLKGCLAFEM